MTNILYSNINCPFCARARNALFFAGIDYKLIEVDLSNKPEALFKLSPKGTVPVLVTSNDKIIDESIEIVRYCAQNAPEDNWLSLDISEEEIYLNDFQNNFLNAYRSYRTNQTDMNSLNIINQYLEKLDSKLQQTNFISGDKISTIDIMITPFISRFLATNSSKIYKNIAKWLENILRK